MCLDPYCKRRVAQSAFTSTHFTVQVTLSVILLLNGARRQKQPRISLNVKRVCLQQKERDREEAAPEMALKATSF